MSSGRTSPSASPTSRRSSAIYSVFAIALATGGPPMIWCAPHRRGSASSWWPWSSVRSSRSYPVAGGVYPWARRLWGRKWAWMTGWVYLVALLVTIAAVVYGAGPFIAALLGIEPRVDATICARWSLIALATVINFRHQGAGEGRDVRLHRRTRAVPSSSAAGCCSPTATTTCRRPLRHLRRAGDGRYFVGLRRRRPHRRLPVLRLRGLRRRRRGGPEPGCRSPRRCA